jgi:hypothetical protein
MAHLLGVPWDDDKQVPQLDDLSSEHVRNYVCATANLIDVVEDQAKRLARVEANHVLAAFTRGHVGVVEP